MVSDPATKLIAIGFELRALVLESERLSKQLNSRFAARRIKMIINQGGDIKS